MTLSYQVKPAEPGEHWIDITQGMSGHFAVEIWSNPDGPFPEPWQTGIGRYATAREAYDEAKSWADNDDLPLCRHPELES